MMSSSQINALFINTHKEKGGAALAAKRLSDALQSDKLNTSFYYKEVNSSLYKRAYNKWKSRPFTCTARPAQTLNLVSSNPWKNASLYHFHNLHGDFVDLEILAHHHNQKPCFLTIHDMWSFTGHCSYSYDCQKYETGCGGCPDLEIYPGISTDSTAEEISLKKELFSQMGCHFISPSRWMANCFKESLLCNLPIEVIPYPIDTSIYHPTDKEKSRQALGMKPDVFTILITSADLSDPRKSQAIPLDAINALAEDISLPIQVISMGSGSLPVSLSPKVLHHSCGFINQEVEKVRVFNAADLFLFSSQADNLPLSIQESLACGTPVLSNKIGGVDEMVIDGKTGWLLENKDKTSFYNALKEIMTDLGYKELSESARSFASQHYDSKLIGQRHLDLYKQALS